MKLIRGLSFLCISIWAACLGLSAQVPGYIVTTVAGGGSGGDGGPALNANLGYPVSVAFDAVGNLYVSDLLNNVVRRISAAGKISTFAGGGGASQGLLGDGGPATSANLKFPLGLCVDAAGNVFIADTGNGRIRKVTPAGIISTVVGPGSTDGVLGDGGPATSATLSLPLGLAVDSNGSLYIADAGHVRVRKVTPDGIINTVAGGPTSGLLGDGGPATKATLLPTALAFDSAGNIYIADYAHNRIRKVSSAGVITTVAGNGTHGYSGDGGLATLAEVNPLTFEGIPLPQSMTFDPNGNLYIADSGNGRVRVVSTDGKINAIAGDGSATDSSGDKGPATSTGLAGVTGLASAPDGSLYVSEVLGYVRQLSPSATPVFPKPSISSFTSAGAFGQFNQLAVGSWVEIYGSYLASDSRPWSGSDFSGMNAPTILDGTSVTIGGVPAFVDYISPGQINVQVPTNIGTGVQSMIVTTKNGSAAPTPVTVNGVEPGLLAPASFVIGSVPYTAALLPDGATFAIPAGAIAGVPSRPAKAGDTITLYGVGFGNVTPPIPAGQIAQGSSQLGQTLQVYIASTLATVTYSGLAPGAVGLYQINVVVPKLNGSGIASVRFTLGGVYGPQNLYIAVQ